MARLWQTVTYVGELIVVAGSILPGQRQQVLFENWNVIHFILLALENRANARSNQRISTGKKIYFVAWLNGIGPIATLDQNLYLLNKRVFISISEILVIFFISR